MGFIPKLYINVLHMDRIILLCHGKIVIFPLKILYYLDKSTTEYHPTACAFVLYTLYKYKRFVTLPVRSAYPLCEEIHVNT